MIFQFWQFFSFFSFFSFFFSLRNLDKISIFFLFSFSFPFPRKIPFLTLTDLMSSFSLVILILLIIFHRGLKKKSFHLHTFIGFLSLPFDRTTAASTWDLQIFCFYPGDWHLLYHLRDLQCLIAVLIPPAPFANSSRRPLFRTWWSPTLSSHSSSRQQRRQRLSLRRWRHRSRRMCPRQPPPQSSPPPSNPPPPPLPLPPRMLTRRRSLRRAPSLGLQRQVPCALISSKCPRPDIGHLSWFLLF